MSTMRVVLFVLALTAVTYGKSFRQNLRERVVRAEETARDPECMSGEFDLADEGFNLGDARKSFEKCRILVMRNAIKSKFMNRLKKQFTKLLRDIQSGAVSYDGRTSDGRKFFFSLLNFGRWEMILPLAFAHPELLLHGEVSHILQSPKLLGDGFVLHSLGAAISVPGAPAQPWHTDAPYLFKESSLEQSGVAGHDLPSYAVTMMLPLLNMTKAHGPTEFCIGSSHVQGTPHDLAECGGLTRKAPLLNLGDLILFDYQVLHRGLSNPSKELRSLLYLSFSRFWFKDHNFNQAPTHTGPKSLQHAIVTSAQGKTKPSGKVLAALAEKLVTARFSYLSPGKKHQLQVTCEDLLPEGKTQSCQARKQAGQCEGDDANAQGVRLYCPKSCNSCLAVHQTAQQGSDTRLEDLRAIFRKNPKAAPVINDTLVSQRDDL